jgi:transglutaminase-like putative cysteine protease
MISIDKPFILSCNGMKKIRHDYRYPLFSRYRVKGHQSLLAFLLLAATTFAAKATVEISPPPSWVEDSSVIKKSAVTPQSASTGYYYLFLNFQENVAGRQRFRHSAVKLLTSEGVQEMSDVSISFDPSYQTLAFHSLALLRNGVRIEKLHRNEIRIVQREENMDRYLYDGRVTAIVNLTDVRVGDVIDFSYSLTGENPINRGRYATKVYLQYTVPIERLIYRVTVPADRILRFTKRNGAADPEKQAAGATVSYRWNLQKLPALLYDINTPDWYDPFPAVAISEYGSWGEVVRRFTPLFSLPAPMRDRIQRRLKEIVKANAADSVIEQSIRFVQDHIRYLGFENGIGAHVPTAPLTVLDQRFGDCKAKSFLLCEILKANGIPAYPVLVNTDDNVSLSEDLPSPTLFNHCIVVLFHRNRRYWIDPTISCQGGDLDHRPTPNYRYGLVLKEGSDGIDSICGNLDNRTRVTETFTLRAVGGAADLFVSTKYFGASADRMRSVFNNTDVESLKKDYVNFYSRAYPGVRAAAAIAVLDKRDKTDEFTVEERYTVDSVWKTVDAKKKTISMELYPLSLDQYVTVKKTPRRTMPYHVYFPLDYEHRTVVHVPEQWSIDDDTVCIHDSAFNYTKSIRYRDSTLTIVHTYATFKDHIAPARVDDFIGKHKEIEDNLPYTLTYTPGVAATATRYKVSLPAIVFVYLILGICIFAAVRIYQYGESGRAPPDVEPRPIGGWLCLVGLGILLSPLRCLYDIWQSPQFFNRSFWSALFVLSGTVRNFLLGILSAGELVYNCALLVYLILIIILFFKRRTIFPIAAISLYLLVLVVQACDLAVVAALKIKPITAAEGAQYGREIFQAVVAAAIWVPYLFLSKRVKETFVVRAPKQRVRTGS